MRFYVYQSRKHLGYIFLLDRRLWCKVDRFSINKFLSQNEEIEVIHSDVRAVLDSHKNLIPIGSHVYDCYEHKWSLRSSEHYFTYYLDEPQRGCSLVMNDIFSSKNDSEVVRKFLVKALRGHSDKKHLQLYGDCTALFRRLSQLYPLVVIVPASFYCEETAKVSLLEKYHSARLFLCDIGKRTLRVAQSSPRHKTQYRSLVHVDGANAQGISLLGADYEDDEPNAREILGWILNL